MKRNNTVEDKIKMNGDKNIFLSKKEVIGRKINPVLGYNQAITDFFNVKATTTSAKKQRKRQQEDVRITPLTDLIAARRNLTATNELLTQSRKERTLWGENMQMKWQALQDRQRQLRESFILFNNFIEENSTKRARAEMKIEKEKQIQNYRAEEIIKLEESIKYLKSVEKQLDEKVKEFQIYKQFLSNAAKETSEFAQIHDILTRYEILSATQKELGAQQASALASVQETREKLTDTAKSQEQIIMKLHTELADLRVRRDQARTAALKWDSILSRVRAFAAQKAIEVQQVRNSCWDLYKTICRLRKEQISLQDSDTEQQLAYISRRIIELNKVATIARTKTEKHKPASNAITATSSLPSK